MDCDLGVDACIAWYRTQLNQGLVSRDGWVLVDDSGNPALQSSNFSGGSVPWRIERPWSAGYQDWYFFGHGHDYKQAVADFAAVSGPISMLDVQAYGVWHSRYHAYSAAQYMEVVDRYSELGLPLNVAVLDMDWHTEPTTPGCDSYGGYVWNASLFPDPANFTRTLKSRGLRVIVNTHDVTGVDHCQGADYVDMAAALGVDATTNATVQCELQNETYARALYELVLDPLRAGPVSFVDWFWTDWGKDDGVWLLWSNYLHCQRSAALGSRGLVLTPYGGLGNHRYPQVGSGDTDVAFETLAFEVYSTFTAANVLTPWTHDLGGFHQTAFLWPTPELWLRWVQFGVFSPSFRTHCTREGACEPWDFPETQAEWTAAFQLRNALVPYVYSAAFSGLSTGLALAYPLYYDWPEAPEAYSTTTEYLFGPAMLVAPVVNWKAVPRAIWLPPGTWVEWCTNTSAVYAGPLALPSREFGLAEIPVFVRGGSVVPLKGLADAVVPPVAPRRLVFLAFPGGGSPSGPQPVASVFEDEGEGLGYLSGRFWRLDTEQDARGPGDGGMPLGLSIRPHAGGGGYAGERPSRAYSVQFLLDPSAPPLPPPGSLNVTANGAAVPEGQNATAPPPTWRIARVGAYAAIVVDLADSRSGTAVVVRVEAR